MNSQDPLAGTWYNLFGAKVDIKVDGDQLSGVFHSKGGRFSLCGKVDPDRSRPSRPLSFAISWISEGETKHRAVTSNTGHYNRVENEETGEETELITTSFLLADELTAARRYATAFVGYDNFYREKLSEREIERELLTQKFSRAELPLAGP